MTLEAQHQATLVETAKLELDRVHRAVLALDAGEIRRGTQIALQALHDAAAGQGEVAPSAETLRRMAADLALALADLQDGKLAEMGKLVEAVRRELDA